MTTMSASVYGMALGLALLCGTLIKPVQAAADDCTMAFSAGTAQSARLESITAHGEFIFPDAFKIRPLGIVMPRAQGLRNSSEVQIKRQLGIWHNRDIALSQLSSTADRWGRHSAWALVDSIMPNQPALSLTLALLADGVGMADPSEVPASCRPSLLKAEADARRAKRGIWKDASATTIDANKPAADLKNHLAQFSLLEGRVVRVGEGRQRNFIDFGTRGSGAASAAMLRRNMAMVLPSGVKLADLKGKKLRLRGVIEWQADRPFILLETAAMIEVLD